MSSPIDYSKTAFSPGIVCYNTNNKRYCVVLDGAQGTEDDRASLVIEFCDNEGFKSKDWKDIYAMWEKGMKEWANKPIGGEQHD